MCAGGPAVIVEIGPGQGALTELLLASGAQVHAVELDPEMVARLGKRFPGHPRLTVHAGDVLDVDLAQWGPAVLAGNLPYYITSPILERIRRARGVLGRSTVLIQKEVADRVLARAGTRDYGYLTVVTQSWAEVRHVVDVPPEAFRPPPKVDSAVIELVSRADAEDDAEFLAFVGEAFRQKRKNLRNNLVARHPGISEEEGRLRAEQLDLAQLRALWRKLS